MLKRKKNVIILILVTVLLIVAMMLCMIYKRTNCVKFKKGEIYYNYHIFATYDSLLEEYGKPQKEYADTYNEKECWVVCYDGATAVFKYNSERQTKLNLINAVISSDNFWKGKSFTGWEKNKIKKKFKYSRQAYIPEEIIHTYFNDGIKMDYEIVPYYDDEWMYGIGFIYDQNNIVEKVVFTCGWIF